MSIEGTPPETGPPDAGPGPAPAGRRPASLPVEELERVGGSLALDFANTVGGSRRDPSEWLVDYDALVRWSALAGAIGADRVAAFRAAAAADPAGAEAALAAARAFRERIFRLFDAIARGDAPSDDDLDALGARVGPALARLTLARDGDGFAWRETPCDALDSMLDAIARDAAELLVSGGVGRLKECDADDCAWLFVDTSRNRSRRWCDMADCGNRAKARRHYRRTRAARG